MTAMICYLCSAENPIDGRYCQKCGALLQGQRGMPLQPHDFEAANAPYTGPGGTSGKAIGSLVCGLIVFFFPSSIVAIILGHWALAEIRRSGGRLTGSGMAKTGLVLGYAGITVVPILIIAAVLVPSLWRARRLRNDYAAVSAMRKIVFAEAEFNDSYATGYSLSLESLGGEQDTCEHAGLISDVLASGMSDGYKLTYVATGPDIFAEGAGLRGCTHPGSKTFEIHADPIKRGTTGYWSFFTDQSGVIRGSATGLATVNSPRYRARPSAGFPFAPAQSF
jgi:Domain of unknown function (DUF4190)